MVYTAMFLWGWLLSAFVLGLGMGWIAVVSRVQTVSRALAQKLALLAAALIVVAVAKLLPGRFGYGLDLALVMLALYLGGCGIGSWLRDLVVSRASRAP